MEEGEDWQAPEGADRVFLVKFGDDKRAKFLEIDKIAWSAEEQETREECVEPTRDENGDVGDGGEPEPVIVQGRDSGERLRRFFGEELEFERPEEVPAFSSSSRSSCESFASISSVELPLTEEESDEFDESGVIAPQPEHVTSVHLQRMLGTRLVPPKSVPAGRRPDDCDDEEPEVDEGMDASQPNDRHHHRLYRFFGERFDVDRARHAVMIQTQPSHVRDLKLSRWFGERITVPRVSNEGAEEVEGESSDEKSAFETSEKRSNWKNLKRFFGARHDFDHPDTVPEYDIPARVEEDDESQGESVEGDDGYQSSDEDGYVTPPEQDTAEEREAHFAPQPYLTGSSKTHLSRFFGKQVPVNPAATDGVFGPPTRPLSASDAQRRSTFKARRILGEVVDPVRDGRTILICPQPQHVKAIKMARIFGERPPLNTHADDFTKESTKDSYGNLTPQDLLKKANRLKRFFGESRVEVVVPPDDLLFLAFCM